jgi:hypothetical protein
MKKQPSAHGHPYWTLSSVSHSLTPTGHRPQIFILMMAARKQWQATNIRRGLLPNVGPKLQQNAISAQ